jgi:hypothetical protein
MPPELILKKDPDHQLADLNQIMKAAAVDLAHAEMAIYYDPRNWDESQASTPSHR